jgi:CheY-like chemotaxis protein
LIVPRILLVEDSATQAMEIRMTLEEAGYSVTHAENGRRAVAAL